MTTLTTLLGIRHPIIQAPMAVFGTPQLAAAVTEAGGLGSLALGHVTPAQAESAITALQGLTGGPFNVNFFTHAPAQPDAARETRWLEHLAPHFARTGQARKAVPICTPLAPRRRLAAMPCPSMMPPAAMTGMRTACASRRTSANVPSAGSGTDGSKMPRCPPAS